MSLVVTVATCMHMHNRRAYLTERVRTCSRYARGRRVFGSRESYDRTTVTSPATPPRQGLPMLPAHRPHCYGGTVTATHGFAAPCTNQHAGPSNRPGGSSGLTRQDRATPPAGSGNPRRAPRRRGAYARQRHPRDAERPAAQRQRVSHTSGPRLRVLRPGKDASPNAAFSTSDQAK